MASQSPAPHGVAPAQAAKAASGSQTCGEGLCRFRPTQTVPHRISTGTQDLEPLSSEGGVGLGLDARAGMGLGTCVGTYPHRRSQTLCVSTSGLSPEACF